MTAARTIAKTRLLTQELLAQSKRLDAPTDSARHAKRALVSVVGGVPEYLDGLQTSIEKDYEKLPKEPTLRQNAHVLSDFKLAVAFGEVDIDIDRARTLLRCGTSTTS